MINRRTLLGQGLVLGAASAVLPRLAFADFLPFSTVFRRGY